MPPALVERPARAAPRDARDEARQMLEAEAERQRRVNAQMQAVKRVQLEAEQKKRDKEEEAQRAKQAEEEAQRRAKQEEQLSARHAAERAQLKAQQEKEQARRARAQSDEKRVAEQIKSGSPKDSPTSPISANRSVPQSPSRKGLGFLRKRNPESPRQQIIEEVPRAPPRDPSPPAPTETFIKAGGGGIVPQIDAPISAVNAGDRRVLVECNKSSIKLPVTPTTTPVDLIRSCETVLSESIDPKMSVLLESFSKAGVQRPLRKYEHVRDVMNSWDDDAQNSLILVPIAHGADEELDEARIPKTQPEYSCFIYHSQKPGKWKKEFITLKADGQMTMAKNETGKEECNMCHLSDFDIYSPTQRKLKAIKPPKKTTFAIKSQQKSNIFSDTTNFVHFFSTGDRETSTRFYQAVQGWRSWYLVNVMGEGKREKAALSATPFKLDLNIGPTKGHTKNNSSMDSHYQLGTFMPTMDFDTFEDRKSVV